MNNYIAPSFNLGGFHCPHCNFYAKQTWRNSVRSCNYVNGHNGLDVNMSGFYTAQCDKCNLFSIWFHNGNNTRMIYPNVSSAPTPSPDMPLDIKIDYDEAREIFRNSPRAAAALLRLCIQKLCVHLGEDGQHLDSDIGSLVKKGLPPSTQKAFDIVRVIGNNAVHPGEISVEDSPEITFKLFMLVNIIIENMITRPKEIDSLYELLPDGAKDHIEKRDK